jgi:pyrimidine-nucleoside phosphorylase
VVREVTASRDGVVARLGALAIGAAALELGAGRRTKEDSIDHAVGIMCTKKRGDAVAKGDVLAEVHARDEKSASPAVAHVAAAYELADEAPHEHGILLDVVP